MEHNVTRIFNLFADVGVIYKRLLNHRPVIQNEVHHFVKEFEVGKIWFSLHIQHGGSQVALPAHIAA